MMNLNSIFLRRKNKVVIESETEKLPVSYVATLNSNIAELGYTLSRDVLNKM